MGLAFIYPRLESDGAPWELLNLQPREGKAKAYQVKQVRGVITSYGLARAHEANQPSTDEDASVREAPNNPKDSEDG